MAKFTTWSKNFGKSVKFGSKQVLTELAPNITDTISNSENTIDIIKSLKEIRKFHKLLGRTILGDESYERFEKYGNEAIKNAKNQLKSGKLDFEDKVDFGDDFDFGDNDDFGTDFDTDFDKESSGSSSSEKPTKIVNVKNELGVHQLVGIEKGITAQSLIMTKGFQESIDVSKKMSGMLLAVTHSMGAQQNSYLNDINNNLVNIVKFNNETMSKFAMSSMKFYEDNLNALKKITEEGIGTSYKEKRKEYEYKNTSNEDVFGGGFNLTEYREVVKKNLQKTLKDSPIGMAISMLDDEEVLKMLSKNPLGFLLESGIKSFIPKLLQNSIKLIDNSFKEFFPALIGRMTKLGKDSDSPFLSTLGKIFGFNDLSVSSVDLSRYEKGAIPFDGITKKSIVEVIPTYLRKILTAVSGREEMAFDYEKGVFKSLNKMKKERREEEENTYLNSFSDVRYAISDFADKNIQFKSKTEREEFDKNIRKFIINVGKSGIGFNVKDIEQYKEHGLSDRDAAIVKGIVTNLDRSIQMAMAGSMSLNATTELRQRRKRRNEEGDISTIDNIVNNGMEDEWDIVRHNLDNEFYRYYNPMLGKGGKNENKPQPPINNRRTVTEQQPAAGSGLILPQSVINRINQENSSQITTLSREDLLDDRNTPYNWYNAKFNNKKRNSEIKQKDIKRYVDDLEAEKRKLYNENEIDKSKLSYGDLDAENAINLVTPYMVKDKAKRLMDEGIISEKAEGSILGKITRYFNKPQQMLIDAIDKVDKTMYDIIFGTDNGGSLLSETIKGIEATFLDVKNWLKKNVYDPVKKFLFGEDFTKSKLFQWGSSFFDSFKSVMFGVQGPDGKMSGGILSDSWNEIKNMFGGTGSILKNEVWEDIKKDFSTIGTRFKAYFIGDEKADKDKKEQRPLVDTILDSIGSGINNFKNFIFGKNEGTKEEQEAASKQFTEDFKKKAPKAIATGVVGGTIAGIAGLAGGWGLFGNLFLPGGPIGGALLGTAIGFLRQSEGFKKFLFGDVTTNTAGIIPKGFQNWLLKNKTAIIGGATYGALKGILGGGIIPSFLNFIPGVGLANSLLMTSLGPVFGGIALGLATKSNAVQKLLFGTGDEKDGKKATGILNGEMMQSVKKVIPNMAVGAVGMMAASSVISQLGLIGSLAVSGPIPASIIGAAAGIAIGSKKFSEFMFGKVNEDGSVKGGFADKFGNYISTEIFQPLILTAKKYHYKIGEWFTKSVINPLQDAFAPLTEAMKEIGQSISNFVGDMFSGIGKEISNLFKPVKENLFKIFNTILDPLKWFMNTTLKATFGMVRLATAAIVTPIQVAGAVSSATIKGSVWKDNIKGSIGNFADTILSEDATNGDSWNAFKQIGSSIFNPDKGWRENERTKGIMDSSDRAKERDAKQKEKFKQRKEKLKAEENEYKKQRQLMISRGYSSSDEEIRKKIKDRQKTQKAADNVRVNSPEEKILKASLDTQNTIEVNTSNISNNTAKLVEAMTGSSDVKIPSEEKNNSTNTDQKINKIYGLTANTGNNQNVNKVYGISSSANNTGSAQNVNRIKAEKEQKERELAAAEKTADATNTLVYGDPEDYGKGLFGVIRNEIGSVGKFLWNLGTGIIGLGTSILGPIASLGTGFYLINKILGQKYFNEEENGAGLGRDSRNSRYIEAGIKTAVKGLGNGINFGVNTYEEVQNFRKNRTGKNIEGIGKGIYKGGKWIVEKATKSTGLEELYKIGREKLVEGSKKSIEYVSKPGSEIIKGAKILIEKALNSNIAKTILGSKWIKDARNLIMPLVEKIFSPNIWKKVVPLIGQMTAKVASKAGLRSAATLLTGGKASVAFAVYDGVTGFSNAAQLFRVRPDDVTMGMKAISAVINIIFGLTLSFGAVAHSAIILDLGFTILSQVLGWKWDHRTWLATNLYKLLADKEDSKKLDEAQQNIEDAYERKLKEEGKTSEDYTFQQFLDDEEKNRKGFLSKTIDKSLGAIKSIGNWFSGVDEQGKKQLLGSTKIYDVLTRFSRSISKFFGFIQDGIRNFFKDNEWYDIILNLMTFGSWSIMKKAGKTIYERFIGDDTTKNILSAISKMWNWIFDNNDNSEPKVNEARVKWNQQITGSSYGFTGGGGYDPSTVMISDGDKGMAYYGQNDPRWANKPLSKENPSYGTIGELGCAPTSMAMVVSQMNGVSYDPEDAAADIKDSDLDHGILTGKGVHGDYFNREAKKHGLYEHPIKGDSDLQSLLGNGAVSILGGSSLDKNSPFFGDGHYVVAAGLSPQNPDYALVYNPNGDNKEYSISALMKESVQNGGYGAYFNHSVYNIEGTINTTKVAKANSNISAPAGDYKERGKKIVERAKAYIGSPYSLGAKGGEPGAPTDCGKFISDVFADCGIIIANGARYVPDIYKWFKSIDGVDYSSSDPEPGDLVIWDSSETNGDQGGECSHIGICTGNGKGVIHASGSRGVVEDSSYEWGSPYSVKCLCKFKTVSGGFKVSAFNKNQKKKRKKPSSIFDLFGRLTSMTTDWMMAKLAGREWSYSEWQKQNGEGSDGGPEGPGGNPNNGKIVGKPLTYETKDAQQKVWNYLTKTKGYSRKVASAIMANIEGESRFNTGAIGDEGTSMGLVQWHNERKEALENFASAMGVHPTDINAQLGFLSHEIDTNFDDLIKDMDNASDLREATKIFIDEFERPEHPDATLKDRYPFAQGVYDNTEEFAGGKSVDTPVKKLIRKIKNQQTSYNKPKYSTSPYFDSSTVNNIKDKIEKSFVDEIDNITPTINGNYTTKGSLRSIDDSVDFMDMINAIRDLDVHYELHEAIEYLKIISGNTLNGNKNNDQITNQNKLIKKLAREVSSKISNKERRRMNPYDIDKLGDNIQELSDSSSPSRYELALAISSGKPLKK